MLSKETYNSHHFNVQPQYCIHKISTKIIHVTVLEITVYMYIHFTELTLQDSLSYFMALTSVIMMLADANGRVPSCSGWLCLHWKPCKKNGIKSHLHLIDKLIIKRKSLVSHTFSLQIQYSTLIVFIITVLQIVVYSKA